MASTLSGWTTVSTKSQGPPKRTPNPNPVHIKKETILRGTSHADDLSSEINFIPSGMDWSLAFELDASPSSDFDIAVHGAFESGGTYYLLQDNVIAASATDQSGFGTYAVIASGRTPMPYYKLFVDGDAAFGNGDTMTLYIMTSPHGSSY